MCEREGPLAASEKHCSWERRQRKDGAPWSHCRERKEESKEKISVLEKSKRNKTHRSNTHPPTTTPTTTITSSIKTAAFTNPQKQTVFQLRTLHKVLRNRNKLDAIQSYLKSNTENMNQHISTDKNSFPKRKHKTEENSYFF